MYGRPPYRFIDDPSPLENQMTKPTLTALELTRLKRCQKELRELEDRLDKKTTDEWNPTNPDAESMFILCSIESARKKIDLAIEHHEMYRQPRPVMFDWVDYKEYFNRTFDEYSFKQLYNTVHSGTKIKYPEDKDEE